MQIILKKDVKGTGKAGDVVKVSDGYARNRLFQVDLQLRLLLQISQKLREIRLTAKSRLH